MEKKKTFHFLVFFIAFEKCSVRKRKSEFNSIDSSKQSTDSSFSNLRLGMIIPKRNVKKSVSRNLVKRWTKELLKNSEETLSLVVKVIRPLSVHTKLEKQKTFFELKNLLSLVVNSNSKGQILLK